MEAVQKPNHKISKKAIQVYRMQNIIIAAIYLLILIGFLWGSYHFNGPIWLKGIGFVLLGIFPFYASWSIVFSPIILQKYWRYGFDPYFLRLKHGKFMRVDTVIPMTKIQYVEAEQGPILRKFGLYSLTIGTLSSAHEIPALPEEEAFWIRDLIAYHAKITEVEE